MIGTVKWNKSLKLTTSCWEFPQCWSLLNMRKFMHLKSATLFTWLIKPTLRSRYFKWKETSSIPSTLRLLSRPYTGFLRGIRSCLSQMTWYLILLDTFLSWLYSRLNSTSGRPLTLLHQASILPGRLRNDNQPGLLSWLSKQVMMKRLLGSALRIYAFWWPRQRSSMSTKQWRRNSSCLATWKSLTSAWLNPSLNPQSVYPPETNDCA